MRSAPSSSDCWLPCVPVVAVAQAQTWPQRPVRFIVSLGPGSGADIGARLSRRPADHALEPAGGGGEPSRRRRRGRHQRLHRRARRPRRCSTRRPRRSPRIPISTTRCPTTRASSRRSRASPTRSSGLVVPASLNVASVADLIAQIKAQPGKLNYSTATGMTDLIYDGYFKSAGLDDHARALSRRGGAAHRPRRGPHPGLCGRARDRAAACPGRPGEADRDHQQRSARPTMPDMPTVAQAGFPGADLRRAHRPVRAARHGGGGARPHRRRHAGRSLAEPAVASRSPPPASWSAPARPPNSPPRSRSSAASSRRSPSSSASRRRSSRQLCHDLGRDRLRLEAARPVRVAHDPDPGLEALDRERAVLGQPVLQVEARAAAPP